MSDIATDWPEGPLSDFHELLRIVCLDVEVEVGLLLVCIIIRNGHHRHHRHHRHQGNNELITVRKQ